MQTEDRLSKGLQGNNLCGIFIEGSLLKTIFGREFGHLSVADQKVLYGADADLHGARLDVYIEPEEKELEGKAESNFQRLVTQICKKMKLGQPLEKIAEDLVEEVSVIEPIYNIAGKCGPEYDSESVMEKLAAAEQSTNR